MTDTYRITTPAPTLEQADTLGHELMESAQSQLGFVPNMYAGMAKFSPMLDMYMNGYEGFRAQSGLTSAEQEVVFLTISRGNGCEYCMAAHSMIADKVSEVPAATLEALRSGEAIPDERLAALSAFTEVMFESRGKPSPESVNKFLAAGYEEKHILAIILPLAVKTLSNYANHVNQPVTDEAFSGYAWEG
jgi:AhpD family alkylhydroperoxidase